MKKVFAVVLALLLIMMTGCQFGNPQDLTSMEAEESKVEVDLSVYKSNLCGVVLALFDQELLPFSQEDDGEGTLLLNFLKEETGEDVSVEAATENEKIRNSNNIGEVSRNIRIMSAEAIGAIRGIRLTYKDGVLNQNIVLEIYEYDPATMESNETYKSVNENQSFEMLGEYTVSAEIYGKYLLIYSDLSEDDAHVERKKILTDTLTALSNSSEQEQDQEQSQ